MDRLNRLKYDQFFNNLPKKLSYYGYELKEKNTRIYDFILLDILFIKIRASVEKVDICNNDKTYKLDFFLNRHDLKDHKIDIQYEYHIECSDLFKFDMYIADMLKNIIKDIKKRCRKIYPTKISNNGKTADYNI